MNNLQKHKIRDKTMAKKKRFPKTLSGFCFDSQPQQRVLACISLFTANNETSNNCMRTVPPSVSHLFYFLSLPSCPTLLLSLNYLLFFFFSFFVSLFWFLYLVTDPQYYRINKFYYINFTCYLLLIIKDNNNFNFSIYLFYYHVSVCNNFIVK